MHVDWHSVLCGSTYYMTIKMSQWLYVDQRSMYVDWNTVCQSTYEPPHEKTCFCHMPTTKAQISLCICAVWSTLCCSLLWQHNTYTNNTCYIHNFKTASFWSRADQFESYLLANTEGRFSRVKSHIICTCTSRSVCRSVAMNNRYY